MMGLAQKQGKPGAGAKAELHSIAAMMRERTFEGSFEVAGGSYKFSYSLAKAVVADGKLDIFGGLRVVSAGPKSLRRPTHYLRNVRATLLAAQGGIGTAPPRKQLPADISPAHSDLPIVESTGALSFCGVLYFKLAPLDGRTLGVPADMRQVQLNVRLAPVSDTERGLQGAFSSIVDALYGEAADAAAAENAVSDLNRLLAGS
jgi:hypothetical protein